MPDPVETERIRRELDIELRRAQPGDQTFLFETCTVRSGPHKWKTGRLMRVLDPETDRLVKTELRLQAFHVRNGSIFSGMKPEYQWFCEDEEIDILRTFLTEHHDSGRYVLIEKSGGIGEILDVVTGSAVDAADIVRLIQEVHQTPELASKLAETSVGGLLSRSIELERRRHALCRLRRLVEDPSSNEHTIHQELKGQSWIFGGNFVGEVARRQLFTGGILDIPLIRGDGSLHVVELKQAHIPKLVISHRTGHIVGSDINEGVGQIQTYLRSLDEKRAHILADFKVDARRAQATVLIGDTRRTTRASREIALETIRTYNSHLSRIEVMTYDQLLESADRAVEFASARQEEESEPSSPRNEG